MEHLNSKMDTLEFTLEYSLDEISFLDVKVKKDNNNQMCSDLFRKDTDARNYLRFDSAHPISCKKGIPYGEFVRARRLYSNMELYDKQAVDMAHPFLNRCYPQDLVESAMVKARPQNREDILRVEGKSENTNHNSELIYIITAFNPESNILGNIVKQNLPC